MRLATLGMVLVALLCAGCRKPAAPQPAPAEQLEPVPSEPIVAPAVPAPEPVTAAPAPPRAPSPDSAKAVKQVNLIWTTRSAAAGGTVAQAPGDAPHTCKLTYTSERINQVVWSSHNCIATADDLRFVAPDGRRVMVIHDELAQADWPVSTAVELTNEGERYAELRASALLPEHVAKVVVPHVHWLQGAAGEAGPAPALSAEGDAVDFTRVDGVRMRIDFSGHVSNVEEPPPAQAAAASPTPEPAGAPEVEGAEGATGEDAAAQQRAAQDQAAAREKAAKEKAARDAAAERRAVVQCQFYGHCQGKAKDETSNETDFQVKDTRSDKDITRDGPTDENIVK